MATAARPRGETDGMRRPIALLVALASAVALLPGAWAGASAATTSDGPVMGASPAWAPHIPGARRYDGSVPSAVTQVVVVRASSWSSTTATLRAYVRDAAGWRLSATWSARLGYGGLVLADQRTQGSGKTPAGIFRVTQAFGRQPDPGARIPYTKVTTDDWWVQDRRSAYYNQMRRGSQGGFALTTSGYYGSEHLWYMGSKYDYVTVVDFNRPNPVVGRGSGIFVHAHGTLSTGCITVEYARSRALARWWDPARSPRIIIGVGSWLDAAPA